MVGLKVIGVTAGAAVLASLIGARDLIAETEDPSMYQQIPPTVLEDFARAFKVSPDNPELRAIFEETNRQLREQPFGNIEALQRAPVPAQQRPGIDSRSLETSLPRLRVVKHFQFGEGLPFVPAQPAPESESWREGTKSVVSYFQNSMRESAQRARTVPPLPDCSTGSVTRARLDSGNPEFDRVRQDDFLYLRGQAPVDAQARFGEQVVVIECGSERGDSCAISASVTNVRCLPTRVLMRNGQVTRIEGAKALEKVRLVDSNAHRPTSETRISDSAIGEPSYRAQPSYTAQPSNTVQQ